MVQTLRYMDRKAELVIALVTGLVAGLAIEPLFNTANELSRLLNERSHLAIVPERTQSLSQSALMTGESRLDYDAAARRVIMEQYFQRPNSP